MAKRSKAKPTHKFKSFSEMHGSKSPIQRATPEQLGHDQQLPVNPPTQGGSPLLNPGQTGHPISSSQLGVAAGYDPSGEEFY